MTAENQAVRAQYNTSENLKKRMRLFSSNESETIWEKLWRLYQFSEGERILEIGGGNGEFWVQNLEQAALLQVTFTDQSPGMVDEAKQRIEKQNFLFETVNAHSLPYGDCSFDWVLAHFMLYHLHKPKETFAEIARVLKPGGRFGMVLFDRVDNAPEPQYQVAFDLLPGLEEIFERTSRITLFGEDARALTQESFQIVVEDINHQTIEHTDAEILGESVLSLPAFKTEHIPEGFTAEYKAKLAQYISQNGPVVTHHKTCTLIVQKNAPEV